MGENFTYLTRDGYNKLFEELEYLKNTRRRELSKEVGTARAHGDLRENAEYHAAKEALAMNESRIVEIEKRLANARIIEDAGIAADKAFIGATVKLKDMDSSEELEYILVSEAEADYAHGKISVTSPVGKSLLGHKENETVEIKIPAGILKYKILKISR